MEEKNYYWTAAIEFCLNLFYVSVMFQVAGLRFTFLVNFDLINAIQQESAKMNTPLT